MCVGGGGGRGHVICWEDSQRSYFEKGCFLITQTGMLSTISGWLYIYLNTGKSVLGMTYVCTGLNFTCD